MSQTFIIKPRKNDINGSQPEVDLERSILDVRKAYSNGTEQDFALMYRRRYRVSETFVLQVLNNRKKILQARMELPGLAVNEFVELFCRDNRVKTEFVRMVLQMEGKAE
ncbi:hypothetical protein [Paenibacillus elgii]|uniref:hypothetical protein n=1 Tax=Paenibacillus elgii TaxID=189691 RepID=UPI000248D920|nr:hypothetical protein [Paenibacillus elgii]